MTKGVNRLEDLKPPCSLAAEQALLGGVMLDPERVHDLEGWLRPENFYYQRHQIVFEAMLELAGSDRPVDGGSGRGRDLDTQG